MRILIVEDEVRLAEALAQIMAEQKYQVDQVHNGADGLDYALTAQYDVIVLDVMLPKLDGLEVARRLRSAHVSTPILMLTARDEISDKVKGLDCGADDYMTKPFDTSELLARVRALTRRQGEVVSEELAFGDLSLHLSSHCLLPGRQVGAAGLQGVRGAASASPERQAGHPQGRHHCQGVGAGLGGGGQQCGSVHLFLRKKLSFLASQVSIGTVRKVGYFLTTSDEPGSFGGGGMP